MIRHELCVDEWAEVAKALEQRGETVIVGTIFGSIRSPSLSDTDVVRLYFDREDTAKVEAVCGELGIS